MNEILFFFKRLIGRSHKLPLFIFLISIWIFSGLVGHHPWKTDDAVHFSALLPFIDSSYLATINQYYANNLNVTHYFPIISDEIIYSRTNFFYILTSYFVNFFKLIGLDYFFQLHDLARLSQSLYLILLIYLVVKIGDLLYGKEIHRYAGLIFIGNLGLLTKSHEFSPENAWLACCAITLYGLLLTLKQHRKGLFWTFLGIILTFLIKDSLFDILALISGWSLIYFSDKTRENNLFKINMLLSTVLFAIIIAIEYFFFKIYVPEIADFWLNMQYPLNSLNILDLDSFQYYIKNLFYYSESLIWFAFPSLPLTLWYIWYTYKINKINVLAMAQFSQESYFLILFSLIYFLGIITLPQTRDSFLSPLLISFSLLALGSFKNITRNFSSGLNWFGLTGFGFLITSIWISYISLNTQYPYIIYKKFDELLPNYYHLLNLPLTIFAIGLTIIWAKMISLGDHKIIKRAVINWVSSLTLTWFLLTSIWIHWLDAGKSYEPVFKQVYSVLTHYDFYKNKQCISYFNIHKSQKTMLFYYAYLIQKPMNAQCDYILVQSNQNLKDVKYPRQFAGKVLWKGQRQGDKEEYYLIKRYY